MTLLIAAVEGRTISLVDAKGALIRGRHAARDKRGCALPDGETVPDHTHYRRAILRGDLALISEAS